jgi:hypothetical protein
MPATGPEKRQSEKGLELKFEPFFRLPTMEQLINCSHSYPFGNEAEHRDADVDCQCQGILSSFAICTINRLNRQSFSRYPYRASYLGLHSNQKASMRRHNLLAVGAIRAVGLDSWRRPSIGSLAKLIPLR